MIRSRAGGRTGLRGSGGGRSRLHPPLAEDLLVGQLLRHALFYQLANPSQLLERCALFGRKVGGERIFLGLTRTIRTIRTYFSVVCTNTIFPSIHIVFWS